MPSLENREWGLKIFGDMSTLTTHMYMYTCIHVLMRDEKEGRKKQAKSNKQQSKVTHVRNMKKEGRKK